MPKYLLSLSLAALVVVLGVGVWATNFPSYLGNDPNTCNNCHVMDAVYEGWYHSAHRPFAVCVDCHTPHEVIPKYIVKAESGMNHVFHFTFGLIPEPLRAKPATDQIIQANCIRCHSETVSMIADMHPVSPNDALKTPAAETQGADGRYCFECHRAVAHGERGISNAPRQE